MRDTGILISFVIPVYNSSSFLSMCLESLAAQQGHDLEYIFVDDGSVDPSAAMLDEFAALEKRAIVIHQENKGVAAARNTALATARGQWVCFVDSDDMLRRDMAKTIRPYLSHNYDAVFFSWRDFSNGDGSDIIDDIPHSVHNCSEDDIKILTRNILCPSHALEYSDMHFRGSTACWGLLANLGVIRDANIRFPEGVTLSEDTAFMLKFMSRCTNILCLGDVLYYHRRMIPTSLTNMYNINTDICVKRSLKSIREAINDCYSDDIDIRQMYYGRVLLDSRNYFNKYLINKQCALPKEKRIELYDIFRHDKDIAEGIDLCRVEGNNSYIRKLREAYGIEDAAVSFNCVVRLLKPRNSSIKRLARKFGLVPVIKSEIWRVRRAVTKILHKSGGNGGSAE